MATPAEIAQLRDMINELDDTNGWTDEKLEEIIDRTLKADGTVNLRRAAGEIWEAKAGSFATLNDVTESGSSRRLSQTFDHYMKMAALFGSTDEDPIAAALASRPVSEKIVRPTRG
jgi:hypothetical protein